MRRRFFHEPRAFTSSDYFQIAFIRRPVLKLLLQSYDCQRELLKAQFDVRKGAVSYFDALQKRLFLSRSLSLRPALGLLLCRQPVFFPQLFFRLSFLRFRQFVVFPPRETPLFP